MLEFDVTESRARLRELRKKGISVSFNAWLIKVIGSVVSKHPEAAAYFYNKKKIKETYFNTDSQGITAFANQTKQDEFGHIVPFVLITLYATYLLISKNYVLSISIIVSNIVFNLYPVLMQRHHRTYKAKD